MQQGKVLKTFKLDGKPLDLAKQWHELSETWIRQNNDLITEFKAKQAGMAEAYQFQMRMAWFRMMKELGIPAEETWTSPGWSLDTTYLKDHGLALLVQREVEQAPSWPFGMMPVVQEPESPEPEEAKVKEDKKRKLH